MKKTKGNDRGEWEVTLVHGTAVPRHTLLRETMITCFAR